MRDQLYQRTTQGGWSPIDFAPHHWREIEADLLDLESRTVISREDDLGDLTAELERLVAELTSLKQALQDDASPSASLTRGETVVQQVALAWVAFRDSEECVQFRDPLPEDATSEREAWKATRDTVRMLADVRYRLSDLLRIQGGRADAAALSPAPLERLIAALTQLEARLRDLRGQTVTLAFDVAWRHEQEQLRQAWQSILDELSDLERTTLSTRVPPLRSERAWQLLRSPMLAAPNRQRLLSVLFEPPAAATDKATTSAGRPLTGSRTTPDAEYARQQEDQIGNSTRLNYHYVAFVVGPLKEQPKLDSIERTLRKVSTELANRDRTSRDPLYAAIRALTLELRDVWNVASEQHLKSPTPVSAGSRPSGSGEGTDRADVYRVLTFLDARRVGQVTRGVRAFLPQPFQPPMVPDRLDLYVTGEGATNLDNEVLTLDVRSPVHLQADLKWRFQSVRPIEGRVQFPPDVLVRLAGSSQPLKNNQPFPVSSENPGALLKFEVLAAKPLPRDEPVSLNLEFSAGPELRKSQRVRFRFPLPNELRLLASRVELEKFGRFDRSFDLPPRNEGASIEQGMQLQPFIQRKTLYRFSLDNRSGKEKQVRVRLYQIPTPVGVTWPPHRILHNGRLLAWVREQTLDSAQHPLPNLTIVAETPADPPLVLPPNGKPLTVNLLPPGASPPKPAPAAGNGQTPPAAPAPGMPIDQGLLCVISNERDAQEQWLQWLQFSPLQPKEYVTVLPAYFPATQEFQVEFKFKDLDRDGKPDAPAGLQDRPVEIRWELRDPLTRRSQAGRAQLTAERLQTVSRSVLPADSRPSTTAMLFVDIDGFPRSQVLQVSFDGRQRAEDLKPDLDTVSIRRLELINNATQEPLPPPLLSPGQPLKILMRDELTMRVYLEADGFEDRSFLPNQKDDRIELSLRNRRPGDEPIRFEFFSDRRIGTQLSEVAGSLTVVSNVQDWVRDLDLSGFRNVEREMVLQALLELPDEAPRGLSHRSESIGLILDGVNPTIQTMNVSAPTVIIGETFRVELAATDLSGISQATFVLANDKNENGRLDQGEPVLATRQPPQPLETGRWAADFATSKIEMLAPGEYLIQAQVTDGVGLTTEQTGRITIKARPTNQPSKFIFGPGEVEKAKGKDKEKDKKQ